MSLEMPRAKKRPQERVKSGQKRSQNQKKGRGQKFLPRLNYADDDANGQTKLQRELSVNLKILFNLLEERSLAGSKTSIVVQTTFLVALRTFEVNFSV